MVPTRVLSRRLARGKKRKPSRRKLSRSQKRPARKSLRAGLAERATNDTALGKAGDRSAAFALPTALDGQGREAASLGKRWGEFAGHRHTTSDRAPEERELKRKLAELSLLESELARQERDLSHLRAELLPFQERYFRKVGVRFAKLDEIEARIAEAYAAIHEDDLAARDAARRARERANRSRREILQRNDSEGFDPPPALKRMYRAVARRVHPDLGESDADRRVREHLMANANRAYQSGDERRLQAIVTEYEFCPEIVKGEGTPAELVRVIRKIARAKGRFEEIQEEMERVRSSDLHRFKLVVERKAKQGRDVFADAVAAVEQRIARALAKLRQLEASSTARGRGWEEKNRVFLRRG